MSTKHPFWSETQQAFIEAGQLQPGETVRTRAGSKTTIVSILPRPPTDKVYNLEVHGEHVYQVAELGILVHNTCNEWTNFLKANKGNFSGNNWLQQAQEAYWTQKIVDFEAKYGAKGVHSLAKHGAQTTLAQQGRRVFTGVTPNGVHGAPTKNATRFLSAKEHYILMNKAYNQQLIDLKNGTLNLNKDGSSYQIVSLGGKVIGNGWMRLGSKKYPTGAQLIYGTSARFRFDKKVPKKFFTGYVEP
ncbi:Hypothetical protein PBC10988_2520 [Planctomycetales bacterium 10988]|nr:Hypothetical protein PBC10988_2520 [Planctomycetales bacterium 10988]